MGMTIAGLVLASSVLAALINQLGETLRQRMKHNDEKNDGKDKDIEALKDGLKWVMFDRIRELGRAYIRRGEVGFDERRILSEMHKSYHEGLGGNGDLDALLEAVYELPLKGGNK